MTACTSLIFKETVFIAAEEYIEQAFKTIRQHFLLCKESYVNKNKLIHQLEERNAQLTKAVELLQRQNVAQNRRYANENNMNNGDKYADANNDQDDDDEVVSCKTYESEPTPVKHTCAEDDLNVAFDNEQMFNTTTDANECIIVETEPIPVTPGIIKDSNTSMSKKITSNHDSKAAKENEQQNDCAYKKETWITKASVRKLRQTRLQFNKNNNHNNNEIKAGVEEIGASPVKENLGHAKNHRSWMHSWSRKNTQILFEDDTDCDDSDFTENSPKKIICKKPKTNQEKELNTSHIIIPKGHQHEELIEPTTSQSLMLVSPEPPEVVFLDDSTTEDEDTTQLKTMDLLKLNATFLERVENKCIKKAKNQNYDIVIDKDDNKWLRPLPVTIKPEPQETPKKGINDNQSVINNDDIKEKCTVNVTENINNDNMQEEDKDWQVLDNDVLDAISKMEEDVDEFYHRPILIKEEPKSKDAVNAKKQPLSDVDMEMGMDSMQLTPDNFWNPFLESFKEGDPRREVLRDPRLENKKK